MSDRAVRLHRVIRANPEKLYRAFTEAEALAKWLPPHGFTCTVHHLEAKVGGSFRMSFRHRPRALLRRRISGAGTRPPRALHRPL